MIALFKNSLFVISCLVTFSCQQSSQHTDKVSNQDTTVESLPFFNQPDWTPEWINSADSNFKKIHTIPDFSFINQDGEVITQQTITGKIYVSNFFFTRCRGICPKMASNMALLQEAFQNDQEVQLLSHSVTPVEDSVPVLKAYAAANRVNAKKWNLLTGDKKEIYELAKKHYFAGDSIGYFQSGDEFLHTENFILVDKHRRIRGVYNGTLLVEINRIKEDIALLKNEN